MPVPSPVLRRSGRLVLAVAGFATALAGLLPASPAAAFSSVGSVRVNSFESRLLVRINQARHDRGIAALVLAPGTTDVARRWAAHQAFAKTMEHNPNLTAQVAASGSSSWGAIGENVGYGGGTSPDSLFDAYMNSQAHRDNMLNSRFHYIGVGWAERPDGVGYNTLDFVDAYSSSYGPAREPAFGGVADKRTYTATTAFANFDNGTEPRALGRATSTGLVISKLSLDSPGAGDESGRWSVRQTSKDATGNCEMRLRDSVGFDHAAAIGVTIGAMTGTGRALSVDVLVRSEFGNTVRIGTIVVPHGATVSKNVLMPASARNYRNEVVLSVSIGSMAALNTGSLSGRNASLWVKSISVHV